MALTRRQIIDEALGQAGRPDLVSQGRLWLNLFLEKIYKTQDFTWLTKPSGETAITQNGAFPSDYWKMKDAELMLSGNYVGPLVTIVDPAEYASAVRNSELKVYLNERNRTFDWTRLPGGSYTWQYFYGYIPTIGSATSSADDSTTPTWGLHDEVLVRAVQLKALYYNDDKRYNDAIQELMKEIVEGKMNSQERRAGFSRLKMGKSFRSRF